MEKVHGSHWQIDIKLALHGFVQIFLQHIFLALIFAGLV